MSNKSLKRPATPDGAIGMARFDVSELSGRFVVSAVMVKEIPRGINVQNKLYAITAMSRDEAHGKAMLLVQSDFPEHRLHTMCSFAIQDVSLTLRHG